MEEIKVNRELKFWVEDTYQVEFPENIITDIDKCKYIEDNIDDLEFQERNFFKFLDGSAETGLYEICYNGEILTNED